MSRRPLHACDASDASQTTGGAPYGLSKAGHEALVATMAQELEGTGVTANVLVPSGATNTNLIAPDAPYDRAALIQSEVMQAVPPNLLKPTHR
jgi:NAD(P)-dependent dehydrogenase (short-subunit alcohol dehydrogenase family)